jgi:DNA-binding NarL/FixJ family response regulator
MQEAVREQARQWLANLSEALAPWRLVIVSGNDLFASVMVWSYPGEMGRAASLADLRQLLQPAGSEKAAGDTSPAPGSTIGAIDPASLRPLPQQILPIPSDPPGSLANGEGHLFFLLCDDLADGELEHTLAVLQQSIPVARRRVLAVLDDNSDRQRLHQLQDAGLDGLCTLGSCGQGRVYTALAAIANGGTYIDPLFRKRLQEPAGDGQVRSAMELTIQERRLLRELCRGYNSQEIAARQGLADYSVRRYLSRVYQRLGVRDRAQAIGWCFINGLVNAAELEPIFQAKGRAAAPRGAHGMGLNAGAGHSGCHRPGGSHPVGDRPGEVLDPQ